MNEKESCPYQGAARSRLQGGGRGKLGENTFGEAPTENRQRAAKAGETCALLGKAGGAQGIKKKEGGAREKGVFFRRTMKPRPVRASFQRDVRACIKKKGPRVSQRRSFSGEKEKRVIVIGTKGAEVPLGKGKGRINSSRKTAKVAV